MKQLLLVLFLHIAPPSKVHKYKPDEINLADLTSRAETILGVKPYAFQLEIATAVLCGEDVIVDVGTSSGKTLCVLPEQPFELMVKQHAKFASGGGQTFV